MGRRTGRLAPLLVSGLIAALGCREDAESPTAPDEPAPALTTTSAQVLSFRQVSAGFFHTCGVTTANVAYCWGDNFFGALGDGTKTDRPTPFPVAGGRLFRQVTSGWTHTCGVALDDLTYCWGANNVGQLGDGTLTEHLTPGRVHASGLRFRRVTAGSGATCGVTGDNRAYCWGGNFVGNLGDGTTTNRLTPVAVAGAHRFRQVSTGGSYACGVTTSDVAYCWGWNDGGQLGDGTTTNRLKPVAVAGGLQFRQVNTTGSSYTCGTTQENRAYCWGQNDHGRLGNGTLFQSSLTPTRVRGGPQFHGIRFRAVTAGLFNACGVTPENRAYCWGRGAFLGDGTTTDSRTPVPVVGGFFFRQVDVGDGGTCGVTIGNQAYCWGVAPVPVAGE